MFDTSLGTIGVKVSQVLACLCSPEPLVRMARSKGYRGTLCSISNRLPRHVTPELSFLCARTGAALPYRFAADRLGELCGIGQHSHMRMRRETMKIGEYIEE